MFDLNRETYRTRLRRGWCIERAREVVPISTDVGGGDLSPTVRFKYIYSLVRVESDGYKPMFRGVCECGNYIHVCERDLFYDLHCGCKDTGRSVNDLDIYNTVENDKDYAEYCKKKHIPKSVRTWRTFRRLIGAPLI